MEVILLNYSNIMEKNDFTQTAKIAGSKNDVYSEEILSRNFYRSMGKA